MTAAEDPVRARIDALLDRTREQWRRELDSLVVERNAALAAVASLQEGIAALDQAGSLSEVLDVLVARAALHANRVALLVARGGALRGWAWHGFEAAAGDAASLEIAADDPGFVAAAARHGLTQTGSGPSDHGGLLAPPSADHAAVAVPLSVHGRVVAVLYADDDGIGDRVVPSAWPELLDVLSRHASRCLESLTARRLPDLLRASATERARRQRVQQDEESAQRCARLLVAEIKLYHEPAVDEGRQNGDLLRRLRPQVERARQLYAERVDAAIRARTRYFEDELIRTLADGNPTLLGQPA